MEMIKGIQGHGYYDELVVPIIENTAYENELTDSLTKAVSLIVLRKLEMSICNKRMVLISFDIFHSHFQIEAYPKATAVLVRNHGVYIWGDSWIHAKTQVCASYFNIWLKFEKPTISSMPFSYVMFIYLFASIYKL